jgi:hypothetical protein
LPDPICLSVTHDVDYGEHAAFEEGATYNASERERFVASFSSGAAALRAARLKQLGGVDFKAQLWAEAAAKYAAAGEYVERYEGALLRAQEAALHDEQDLMQTRPATGSNAATEAGAGAAGDVVSRVTLWLNEAQCRLNLEQHDLAEQCCSSVLATAPTGQLRTGHSVKAHFRRGRARIELGDFVAAREDLVAAAKLEPANRDVRSSLAECTDRSRAEQEREREVARRAIKCSDAMTVAAVNAVPHGEMPRAGEFDVLQFLAEPDEELEEVD